MTEQTQSEKWRTILFFCFAGILFCYLVYSVVTSNVTYDQWQLTHVSGSTSLKPDDRLTLPKDKQKTIGKLKITYRGIRAKSVIIEFALTDLDPNYAYRRIIPINEAKHGFRLSDELFRLESASRFEMQLTSGP